MPDNYILVSAATSSIGSSLVHKLAANSRLIVHGRNEEHLDALIATLECTHPPLKWIHDLSDTANIHSSLSSFISSNGVVVSHFVHCAGMLGLGALRTTSLEKARQVFDVNFFSAVEIIRVLVSKVNAKGITNIVLVSALSSLFGERGNAMYVASKSALDGLTKSLATELAPATRINTVHPGGVLTGMTEKIMSSDSSLLQDNPLGPGTVSNVADCIEFLLSENSRWMTGQHLVVDGGRSRNIFSV